MPNVNNCDGYVRFKVNAYKMEKSGNSYTASSDTTNYGSYIILTKTSSVVADTDGYYYIQSVISASADCYDFATGATISISAPADLTDSYLKITISYEDYMNKEWLEKINMTLEERANLESWCENIGYKRYESICNSIIEKTKCKSVNYSVLKVIAKYDFCLSDFLHSMLKFIELRFRSYLDNNYGELLITRQEFLYQISNKLTNGKRRLDCSTYYDKKLKDETTLGEFLTASSMETLLRVLFLLPKKELEVFNKNIAQLKEELTKIKNARNYVAHGQVLLFNEKFNLKEMVVLMLITLTLGEDTVHISVFALIANVMTQISAVDGVQITLVR